MDSYRAVALAEGFEEGSDEEVIEAWQYLVNTGLAWSLQGWFDRTASQLLNEGVISLDDSFVERWAEGRHERSLRCCPADEAF